MVVKYCSCREIDAMVRLLVREGWIFRWGGKHGRLREPSGRFALTVPGSPGDRRAAENFRHDLRRAAKQAALLTANLRAPASRRAE
ncbi:MAG: type II toxin-antitoxin system HicA family toxin [Sterolibacteriaceae bacterium MAG5]|nr:type II toxin-antitoxin system HicA family toxin [Candidatus Nitricoxidireducens bremensis]